MIDTLQMLAIIKGTLEEMGEKYYSHEAMMLIYNTGLVESKYKYLTQKGGSNIARGFFQCEPWVAVSVCKDYLQYRETLMKKVAEVCYLDWKYFIQPTKSDWKKIMTTNIISCNLNTSVTELMEIISNHKVTKCLSDLEWPMDDASPSTRQPSLPTTI